MTNVIRFVRMLERRVDRATGLSYGVWLPVVRYPGTQFAVPVAAHLPDPRPTS